MRGRREIWRSLSCGAYMCDHASSWLAALVLAAAKEIQSFFCLAHCAWVSIMYGCDRVLEKVDRRVAGSVAMEVAHTT